MSRPGILLLSYRLMFTYEAAILLKDAVCPFCRQKFHIDLSAPFRSFDALEMCKNCSDGKCTAFFGELNKYLNLYETGQVSRPEFLKWLEGYNQ